MIHSKVAFHQWSQISKLWASGRLKKGLAKLISEMPSPGPSMEMSQGFNAAMWVTNLRASNTRNKHKKEIALVLIGNVPGWIKGRRFGSAINMKTLERMVIEARSEVITIVDADISADIMKWG